MLKKVLISTLLISFLSLLPLTTIKIEKQTKQPIINTITRKEKESIGKIIIKKIHLEEDLYPINNPNNNIEKHVTILEGSIPPSLIILAAHSGTGSIAYFNNLNQLEKNDEIVLIYQQNKYTYIVKEYWEEKKNGYINFNKEKSNQLILTTCSPNNKNTQLIINCTIKESN